MTQPHYAVCINCNEEIAYFPGDPVICQCCGANYGILEKTMSEFCPKCSDPLETSTEPDRLCLKCGWFGDKAEVLANPVITGDAATSARQAISLYRDLCRNELILEQAMEQGKVGWDDMAKARASVASALNSLLTIFHATRPDQEEDV